jgi:hypothetical protein
MLGLLLWIAPISILSFPWVSFFNFIPGGFIRDLLLGLSPGAPSRLFLSFIA